MGETPHEGLTEKRGVAARGEADGEGAGYARSAAFLAFDDEGTILSADPRLCDLFGVPNDVVESGSLDRVIEWLLADGDEVGSAIGRVLSSATDDDAGEIASSDGRLIEWSATTLRRGVRGRVYSFRELGHYRAASRALSDAESWLHMFATRTRGAILELDANARIIGTWSAAPTILGFPEAVLQGRTLSEAIGEERAADFDAHLKALLDTGLPQSFEYVLDIDDDRRVYAVDATRLSRDLDEPAVASVLVRDVTEQTRMQLQLVQAERLASVGLLAAGVAHEINNPITYMLLNLRRVRRAIPDLSVANDEASIAEVVRNLQQCIDMTVEGTERVQTIVQDLHRFSRSDPKETRTVVDVRKVLAFTLDMTDIEVRRRARVVRDFGPVPSVLASEVRLSQVFLNLVLNALQAIPHGEPHRHQIRIVTRADDIGRAVVEVHDTGAGIPAAQVRKIFDPFFTTKPTGMGTGLGLAICHGVIVSLGGEISVESKVGVGSTFRVVLPAVATPPPTT